MTFAEPTRHKVRYVVSKQQAMQAMAYARAHDVERGGTLDARSAAINVWSCPWDTPKLRQASELVGSIYLAWGVPHKTLATITELHVEAGYTLADIERNLELLFGGA